MKVNLSTANWLRLQAVFGAPLFLMSCLSNITFFTNADVGYVIFNKAVFEGILCNDLWNNYCMMISNFFFISMEIQVEYSVWVVYWLLCTVVVTSLWLYPDFPKYHSMSQ